MSHRSIIGLISAEPAKSPWIKTKRPRGVKGLGIKYERDVAKAVGGIHNPWFRFVDTVGPGYCCPDIVLDIPEGLFVLECKLSDKELAKSQLTELYIPVLSYVYQRPVRGIVVTKHVTAQSTNICESLREAIAAEPIPTLHWLGRGPI